MRFKSICATACVAALASVATAQDVEFTNYVGSFPTVFAPIPVATNSQGHLFYATFQAANSQLWVVEDPVAAVGSETIPGKHIRTFPEMVTAGRGFQGLDVDAAGKLFLSGDNAGAPGLMFRFDPLVNGSETTYTLHPTFTGTSNAVAQRKLGLDIISSAGNGLIACTSLTHIVYYDFLGNQVGSPVALPQGNTREPQFNSVDNVIYPLRNGRSTSVSLEAIVTGVNTSTGGGTMVADKTLPGADGGANGVPNSHGYYYAAQHQLITVGQIHAASGGTTIPSEIRVWDITENGTSMTLAYSVKEADHGAGWQDIKDAVVIGNRLYVTSHAPTSRVYVYEGVPASVNRWDEYETSSEVDRRDVSGNLK